MRLPETVKTGIITLSLAAVVAGALVAEDVANGWNAINNRYNFGAAKCGLSIDGGLAGCILPIANDPAGSFKLGIRRYGDGTYGPEFFESWW
jgi:hypothetical protein